MHSYVLHIIRHAPLAPAGRQRRRIDQQQVIGLLEPAGSNRRIAFHNIEELWELLDSIEQDTSSTDVV